MIAVAGGKGGVGKTTTALGLASAFARQRSRPLLVDVDTGMPDLTPITGVEAPPGLTEIGAGADPEQVARPAHDNPGVAVIPTQPGSAINDALSRLPPDRLILLDCPGGARRGAVTPIAAADQTLLVTTPTEAAIRDTLKTAAVAESVNTPVLGVVVTMTESPPSGLASVLDAPVLGSVPTVTEDPLHESAVRATYDRLAARLRGKG